MRYYSRIIGYNIVLIGILMLGIYFLFGKSNKVEAKDLGVHGRVWNIEEKDIVSYIKSQITDEKAEEIQKDFIRRSKNTINRPKSVNGISKTIKNKVHYYNPEITLTKDITDHNGNILHKKGTKINPLDYQPFTRQLVFIDGDDKSQVEYAVSLYKKVGNETAGSRAKLNKDNFASDLKIVLIKGSPIELMKKYNDDNGNNINNKDHPLKRDISSKKNNNLQYIRFYFDQEGYLSKTFGIETVPSLVKKEGRLMRVETIVLSGR